MAWDLTRNKIIKRALRIVGATAQGDEPRAEQLSEASDALNAFLKSFNIGTKLWKVRWYSKTLETTTTNIVGTDGNIYDCIRGHVASTDNCPATGSEYQSFWKANGTSFDAWATGTDYVIGDQIYVLFNGYYKVYTANADHTAGATFTGDVANWDEDTTYTAWATTTSYYNIGDLILPTNTLEVLDVWYRDVANSNDTDTPIDLISGQQFMDMWEKQDTDTYPDYAYVDREGSQCRLYLRKIPNDSTSFQLFLRTEEVIDDLTEPGANPDMFNMYYDMLCYGLALRLCPEYGIKTQEKNDIKAELVEFVNIYKQRNKEDVEEEVIDPAF